MAPLNSDVMCTFAQRSQSLRLLVILVLAGSLLSSNQLSAHEEDAWMYERVCTGPTCSEQIRITLDQRGIKTGRYKVTAEVNDNVYKCSVKLDAGEYATFCKVKDELNQVKMEFQVFAETTSTDAWVWIFPDTLPETINLTIKRGFKTLLRLEDYELDYDELVWSYDGCDSCKYSRDSFRIKE